MPSRNATGQPLRRPVQFTWRRLQVISQYLSCICTMTLASSLTGVGVTAVWQEVLAIITASVSGSGLL